MSPGSELALAAWLLVKGVAVRRPPNGRTLLPIHIVAGLAATFAAPVAL